MFSLVLHEPLCHVGRLSVFHVALITEEHAIDRVIY